MILPNPTAPRDTVTVPAADLADGDVILDAADEPWTVTRVEAMTYPYPQPRRVGTVAYAVPAEGNPTLTHREVAFRYVGLHATARVIVGVEAQGPVAA